jgi:hypothetical protein
MNSRRLMERPMPQITTYHVAAAEYPFFTERQKLRILSCGFRRSKLLSANKICPARHQSAAS